MPYFDQVKRFCLFASLPRSGHSIMGHLLSAHPKVLISDELAAANLIKEGFSKDQVFALIKYQDFRHQRRNRQKGEYSYKVEGLWQGQYEKHPEVIGDSKGTRTVRLIGGEDGFLNDLRDRLRVPLCVFIHLRNPFDIISTNSRKLGRELGKVVTGFTKIERQLSNVYNSLTEKEKFIQRHEDVIADPMYHFNKMYEFLGVEPINKVVSACADKLWNKPKQTRNKVNWPKQEIKRVEACMSQSPLFNPYLDGQ
jgi:hypothetical protein